jgi:hypothetical protein
MDDTTAIIAAIQKSGFPLQTRVEHEITARTRYGWKSLRCEYPWRDPDGRDQFVDLIACCGTVVLIIECKKIQDRALLFLRPLGPDTTGLVKRLAIKQVEKPGGSTSSTVVLRGDLTFEPPSYQAQFCVSVEKTGQRMLEQEARPVVLAADAIADAFPREELPSRSFLVPVIVTTAALYTLRYEPPEVSLETGEFDNLDHREIEPIQWVRFHKTFTAWPDSLPRTVFVVNSSALPNFLDEISRGQGSGPVR